jgi:hypothetical protein
LSFAVWVSPKDGAGRGACIKVTNPPWGSNPEAIYSFQPFSIVEGTRWLSSDQEHNLEAWVALNTGPLIDFWDGRILYDSDLRAKLISLRNAPPVNFREAVAALRAIAPKVKAISWAGGTYHVAFDFPPRHGKIVHRFRNLDHAEDLVVGRQLPEGGIVLWTKPA